MQKEILELIEQIEKLGWNVTTDEDDLSYVNLQRFSPAGRDFNIEIEIGDNKDTFIENLYEYYQNFDVSYETYIWLDDTGHGIKGAPYDMRDLYEDTEYCEQMILELYENLQ